MKEFKYCHEEITEGVEIPVTVCETQKEMVAELIMQKDCFDFAAVRMNAVEEKCIKGYFNLSDGTLDQYAYREAMDEAISGTDEEMMYIIYKDGSEYWNGADEVHGKFKRYGIKRAIISTPWGYTVFGDFAINDMGDVTIEGSEIEEYGVYAGQYDVKEQEVQETVEQTAEVETSETTVEQTAENVEETAEVSKEIKEQFEKQKTFFKFYDVDIAYQVERYVNCGSLKYVQLGTYSDYAKAVQAAQEAIEEWGEEHIYFHTVEVAKRNSKIAKDKYDEKILKSEKKEIGYYWYASKFTDSKECVYISIDSPIRIPIETAQKSEMKEVKETAETETAKTDDSGFEYYSVETAYEVTVCEEPTIVFKNYSNALEMAKRNADKYGVMNVFMQAVNFITRNGKQPESDHDKEILADETDQIEARCVWYDYKDLKGFVNTEDAIYMPLHGVGYTRSQAQTVIITATNNARARYRRMHDIHSPMDLKKFSKKRLDDYLSKELDYINKSLNDTLPKEVFNAMKGEIMYA